MHSHIYRVPEPFRDEVINQSAFDIHCIAVQAFGIHLIQLSLIFFNFLST